MLPHGHTELARLFIGPEIVEPALALPELFLAGLRRFLR